jgi:hypothetical protein
MPSPYDPRTFSATSGRAQDARVVDLQRAHDQAKRMIGIKGEVRPDDQRHSALVRALLGVAHHARGGNHHGR